MSDIAIIGIGCRFPGANGPQAFWELLANGRDAVTQIPASRWKADDYFDTDADAAGKMATRWGGFIDGIDRFDAEFFRISAREARHVDPQQRLLLELTWEALEDAGIPPSRVAGGRRWERQKVGVFVGITTNDYGLRMLSDEAAIDGSCATGATNAIAANRISYLFDFHGPSMAIDTACSSSLVALHTACRSLRSGESDLGVAGGINMLLSPAVSIAVSHLHTQAADGRCKTFDAAADGYVRGEGGGIVLLKRLVDAERDGDRIYAVIKGSAINQDGASNGLTAPSKLAQQAVITAALRDAGVMAADISLIEAHGTGTKLGDPIEVGALKAVLMKERAAEQECWLGSVKTNIGHLEAAAGIAGLIKAVLCLHHEAVPPHLHLQTVNPFLPLRGTSFRIPQALETWTGSGRHAGVSAFGFGGANAHVVLAAAPTSAPAAKHPGPQLLALSARSPAALRELAGKWHALLESSPADFADLAYTSQTGRDHMETRFAVVAKDAAEAAACLRSLATAEPVLSTKHNASQAPRVAMLFSGQGAQYLGMGRQLYDSHVGFRTIVDACAIVFQAELPDALPLVEVMRGEHGEVLHQTLYTQPALFAVQMGLYRIWTDCGVVPAALLGHSAGEYAAACAAGMLSLEDGMRLITHRGRLMQALTPSGKMLAVQANAAAVTALLRESASSLTIAAANGPQNTVIAGLEHEVLAMREQLEHAGIRNKLLAISLAGHTALVEPMLEEFQALAAQIDHKPAAIPFFSNVTGAALTVMDDGYWARQIRHSVRFEECVQGLATLGVTHFIDIAPMPVLGPMACECMDGANIVALASLRQDSDDLTTLLASLGTLYCAGIEPIWAGLHGTPGKRVSAPTYPFQRRRHWFDDSANPSAAHAGGVAATNETAEMPSHPLLGRTLAPLAGRQERGYEFCLSAEHTFLRHHQVLHHTVVPAAFFLDMAWQAAHGQDGMEQSIALQDFRIERALVLEEGEPSVVQVVIEPDPSGGNSIRILSRLADENAGASALPWRLHASIRAVEGSDADDEEGDSPSVADSHAWEIEYPLQLDLDLIYREFERHGLQYGKRFRSLRELRRNDEAALGRLELPAAHEDELHIHRLHPCVLDGSLQVLAALLQEKLAPSEILLPIGLDRCLVLADLPTAFWSVAKLRTPDHADLWIGDITLHDRNGRLLARLDGLRLQKVARATLEATLTPSLDGLLYRQDWVDLPMLANAAPTQEGYWLVFEDGEAHICAALKRTGLACILARPGAAYTEVSDELYELAPGSAGDYALLLEQLEARTGTCAGILYLWGQDVQASPVDGAAALRIQEYSCGNLLLLVQALLAREAFRYPMLAIVTRGAHAIGADSPVNPMQAPLAALAPVIENEYPQLRCRALDLEPGAPLDAAALAVEIQDHEHGERLVAVRNGQRKAVRLRRLAEKSGARTPELRIRPDVSYLISGGLGSLGLHAAQWLASLGARHLILLGRNGASASAQAQLTRLQERGVTLHIAALDIADFDAMQRLLEETAVHMPALAGVIHAAGLLEDGEMRQQSWPRWRMVMAPKIAGAWNLHLATRDMPLDFFLCYSSLASVLGSPGQSGYVAANAFLDALAHMRRAQGLPALSINWGLWRSGGTLRKVRQASHQQMRSQGMQPLRVSEAMCALHALLEGGASQAVIAGIDWALLRDSFGTRAAPRLLQSLLENAVTQEVVKLPPLLRQLKKLPRDRRQSERRHDILRRHVHEVFALVLGFTAAPLDGQKRLGEMGMDSLMAMDLRNRVHGSTGVMLSREVLHARATMDDLVAALESALAGVNAADLPQAAIEPAVLPIHMPLSLEQERLWFIHHAAPESLAYNTAAALRLAPSVREDSLTEAVDILFERHAILRANILDTGGQPYQLFRPHAPIQSLPLLDLPSEAACLEAIIQHGRRRFCLESDALADLRIFRTPGGDRFLSVVMHHILIDAWSLYLLLGELRGSIATRQAGGMPSRKPAALQFHDYILHQRKLLDVEACTPLFRYWQGQLQGVPGSIDLPMDAPSFLPAASNADQGCTVSAMLGSAVMTALGQVAAHCSTSKSIVCQALFTLLLERLSGQDDLCTGTVSANREQPELADMVGFFAATLPVRVQVDPSQSLAFLIRQVDQAMQEALAHQALPFHEIVKASGNARDLDRNPLFQVFYNYRVGLSATLGGEGGFERYPVDYGIAQFDLNLQFDEEDGQARVALEYRESCFTHATVEAWLQTYLTLLGDCTSALERPMAEWCMSHGLAGRPAIYIAANFTADPLLPALRMMTKSLPGQPSARLAPYNQPVQEMLNITSDFHANRHGLNVLLLRLEDCLHYEAEQSKGQYADKLRTYTDDILHGLSLWARQGSTGLVLLCPPTARVFADPVTQPVYRECVARLRAAVVATPAIDWLDESALQEQFPVFPLLDDTANEIGHIPYQEDYFLALAGALARCWTRLHQPRPKLIALDCDNTLWSGVLGEDGKDGIRISTAHFAFLQQILRCKEAGMMLVMLSRNEDVDIQNLFAGLESIPIPNVDALGPFLVHVGMTCRSIDDGLDILRRHYPIVKTSTTVKEAAFAAHLCLAEAADGRQFLLLSDCDEDLGQQEMSFAQHHLAYAVQDLDAELVLHANQGDILLAGPLFSPLWPNRRVAMLQSEGGRLLLLESSRVPSDLQTFPLRLQDFVGRRIDWNDKTENLRSLASELNIGLDSIIFIDDNPVECARMQAELPEVCTVQMPATQAAIGRLIQELWLLDRGKTTDEDRGRTRMMQENLSRQRAQEQSHDFASYLASLELQVDIHPMRREEAERLSQLTLRTNQFNASGRRLSVQEAIRLQGQTGWQVHVVDVRDRYGCYGLVGALILRDEGTAGIHIDSMMLSCRVLQRGVEYAMLRHAAQIARASGHDCLAVEFRQSARNAPFGDFLSEIRRQLGCMPEQDCFSCMALEDIDFLRALELASPLEEVAS